MATKENPPAFPVTAGQQVYTHGMTLRDWFAGQALVGLNVEDGDKYVSQRAYEIADAMLAERAKGETP